ncbi:hypothetical protein ONZ51_g8243 [Trametes cubensis]|uniref:Uncharacterized protein n=1 Tax=Trametes cubensis TaxID=1111947 RepID=A0AAD7TNK3_9APHY|nr:hypothetical protein ONZ51_g8243 [Trametes cubensis]
MRPLYETVDCRHLDVAAAEAVRPPTRRSPADCAPPPAPPLPTVPEAGEVRFLSPPPGGFPDVNFSHPLALYDGSSRTRTLALEDPTLQNPVLVHIPGVGLPLPQQLNGLTGEIGELTHSATGQSDPLIAPPAPELSQNGAPRTAPATWAVLHLPADAANRLIERRVWVSPRFALFAYGRPTQTQRYVFSLNGFRASRGYRAEVLGTILSAFTSAPFIDLTRRLLRDHPAFGEMSEADVIHRTLDTLSIHIRVMEHGTLLVAVFCDPPTVDYEAWRSWRDAAMAMTYDTPLHGAAVPWRAPPCDVCRGADHPTPMCPFLRIPGWPPLPPQPSQSSQGHSHGPSMQPPAGNSAAQGTSRGAGRGFGRGGRRGGK